jgi:hypothetical protein
MILPCCQPGMTSGWLVVWGTNPQASAGSHTRTSRQQTSSKALVVLPYKDMGASYSVALLSLRCLLGARLARLEREGWCSRFDRGYYPRRDEKWRVGWRRSLKKDLIYRSFENAAEQRTKPEAANIWPKAECFDSTQACPNPRVG